MKCVAGILAAVVIMAAGCNRAPEGRQYELKGQILALTPERNEVLVRHEDIKGFMPAMTMPYKVKDAELLAGKAPGDLFTGTLIVSHLEAHLSTLTKTGTAPLDASAAAGPAISNILAEGDYAPDQPLIDQDGKSWPLSSLRGHRVALTFVYTRCPLPEFCPLMDRNFVAVQNTIKESPELSDVRLVSVSFDPDYDTPDRLKSHARTLNADSRIWHFVTTRPEEIKAFAAQYGVSLEPAQDEGVLTHNLRTAILDPEGRLVKAHTGNSWTPSDLVADLTAVPAAKR